MDLKNNLLNINLTELSKSINTNLNIIPHYY